MSKAWPTCFPGQAVVFAGEDHLSCGEHLEGFLGGDGERRERQRLGAGSCPAGDGVDVAALGDVEVFAELE